MSSRVALAVVLLLAVPALADNLDPPDWRGQANTSWAQWEFLTDANQPAPDAGYLPFGQPFLEVIPGPGATWYEKQPTWETSFGTPPLYDPNGVSGDGWWNLSGHINVTMMDANGGPHKEIWIQLVWEPQAPGNIPEIQLIDPNGTPTSIPLVNQVLWSGNDPNTYDGSNPWRQVNFSVYHLDINPNPDQETIAIRGGINVDELVIDTICGYPIPEPATMATLGLGAVGVLLRRRRRK